MRLLLSSEALPEGVTGRLASACHRRALEGLELTYTPSTAPPDGVGVQWLRLPPGASPSATALAAEQALWLGAGLLLSAPIPAPPTLLPIALVHGNSVAEAEAASRWAREHGMYTAWEVYPHDLERAGAVLRLTWPTLAHVRLIGAGPEIGEHEGLGGLLVRLALDGYGGTISLAPSPGADLGAWETWLFETRGWGCGSAAQKRGQTRDVRILQS